MPAVLHLWTLMVKASRVNQVEIMNIENRIAMDHYRYVKRVTYCTGNSLNLYLPIQAWFPCEDDKHQSRRWNIIRRKPREYWFGLMLNNSSFLRRPVSQRIYSCPFSQPSMLPMTNPSVFWGVFPFCFYHFFSTIDTHSFTVPRDFPFLVFLLCLLL